MLCTIITLIKYAFTDVVNNTHVYSSYQYINHVNEIVLKAVKCNLPTLFAVARSREGPRCLGVRLLVEILPARCGRLDTYIYF